MYKHIFTRELTLLPETIRARAPKRIPTVLSHDEAICIISKMKSPHKLMFSILYGCGLRKDRVTMLPELLFEPLKEQI